MCGCVGGSVRGSVGVWGSVRCPVHRRSVMQVEVAAATLPPLRRSCAQTRRGQAFQDARGAVVVSFARDAAAAEGDAAAYMGRLAVDSEVARNFRRGGAGACSSRAWFGGAAAERPSGAAAPQQRRGSPTAPATACGRAAARAST